MKIKAISNSSWWTAGRVYDVLDVDKETSKNSTWYQILDDNGEKLDLNSCIDKDDFELISGTEVE